MAKCNSCNGVISKTDLDCYVCGEKIPGRRKFSLAGLFGKTADEKARQATQRVMMRDTLRAPVGDQTRALY